MTLWCERKLHDGRNSGRAVARMSNGACPPRSARACIRSSVLRIRPMQVLEGLTTGCERALAKNSRRQPQLVVGGAIPGARVSTRARPAAGCPPVALTGAHIWRVSRPISRSVFSRSARRRAAGLSAAKRWRPHSAIGCNGVFCSSCDHENSAQVRGCLAERQAKLLDEARLADAGFADHERELALAFSSARSQRRCKKVLPLLAARRAGVKERAPNALARRSRARSG